MAIKLAFSTVACPEWSLEEAARQASQMGYQGLELRTLDVGPTGGSLASDPALTEPAKVKATLRSAGVEAVCLSTSIALHHADSTAARQAVVAAEAAIKRAASIGAPMVRFFGNELRPGDLRQACQTRIAERIKHLAELGLNAGVQVVMENGGSFAKSKDWWWIFNLVDHPMAGICWNVANAAAAGESSAVSVTTLNSRIRLAKVKDTFVGEGSGFVQLGEGTVGIEMFIKRLLGIGYDGYITVEWDRVWLPTLAPASEYLPEAQKRIKGWLDEVAQAIEDAKPKPKKAAAAH